MTVDERPLAAAIDRLTAAVDRQTAAIEDLPTRIAFALAPPARRGTKAASHNDAEQKTADQLRAFLVDACEREPAAALQGRAFYQGYCAWAEGRGLAPVSEKRFSLSMRTLGPTRDRGRNAWWHGVALKPSARRPGAS